MADPISAISAISGVLALATFGLEATSSLLNLIQEFKRAPSTVRNLKDELNALNSVLQSLTQSVDETDPTFSELKLPLYHCAKACQDFELVLSKNVGKSDGGKVMLQEWAKLKFRGNDIHGFKETIAGYKATISIALCSINLRSSAVTLSAFNEYKEMIANTTCDLENHLQGIDEKLHILVSLGTDETSEDPVVRQQILEEKDSILKCLEICDSVSDHIDRLQRSYNESLASARSNITMKPAISTWLAAASNLAGCKRQLEVRIEELKEKTGGYSTHLDSETERAERQHLFQEIDVLQKSIEICKKADKDADQNRTNVFEDVSMGEDGRQIIVSTVGDLIFAKKVKIGDRSLQMMGQMSDMTVQHVMHRSETELVASQSNPEGENFEGRYGAGRNLRFEPQSGKK